MGGFIPYELRKVCTLTIYILNEHLKTCLLDTATYKWCFYFGYVLLEIMSFLSLTVFLNFIKHSKKRSSEKSIHMKLWFGSEPTWHVLTWELFFITIMLVVDNNIIWGKPLLLNGSKIPYVNYSLLDKSFYFYIVGKCMI